MIHLRSRRAHSHTKLSLRAHTHTHSRMSPVPRAKSRSTHRPMLMRQQHHNTTTTQCAMLGSRRWARRRAHARTFIVSARTRARRKLITSPFLFIRAGACVCAQASEYGANLYHMWNEHGDERAARQSAMKRRQQGVTSVNVAWQHTHKNARHMCAPNASGERVYTGAYSLCCASAAIAICVHPHTSTQTRVHRQSHART